jgi:predicted transcriptional regulator
MQITELAQCIQSKEDFIEFLKALIDDYENRQEEWENLELGRYFNAMERFLESSSDKSISKIDFTPSWKLFARIMIAAAVYE